MAELAHTTHLNTFFIVDIYHLLIVNDHGIF